MVRGANEEKWINRELLQRKREDLWWGYQQPKWVSILMFVLYEDIWENKLPKNTLRDLARVGLRERDFSSED